MLWSRTVLKNIMFPLEIAGVPRRRAKQKALELVELVGLKGREKAYPSGVIRRTKATRWDYTSVS